MLGLLTSFFLDALEGKAEIVTKVERFAGCLYIESGCLIFSLSDLYIFITELSSEKSTYSEFQRQLYQSTLNQDLKAHGAQIVVHHSTGKVETNLYRLERIAPVDSSG